MAKLMLVEDDNNLREIYEARLAAEGYTIVSAKDGEEALALAVKERPDLIVADIMMPKVSGLDMLDILRTTPETKHTKIIMMTALSQAEDQARAEKLGADRYLVKSQVTLEDVVRVAAEVLGDAQAKEEGTVNATGAEVSAPSSPVPAPAAAPATTPLPEPVATAPVSVPVATPPTEPTTAPAPESSTPPTPSAPSSTPTSIPVTVADEPTPAPAHAPTTEPTKTSIPVTSAPDDTTTATTEAAAATAASESPTTRQEEAKVNEQIEDFIANNPTLSTSAEPEKEAPAAAPLPAPTAADTTLAKAVDNLAPPANPLTAGSQSAAPAGDTPVSGSPNKKGGERVIQPIANTDNAKPTGQDLINMAASETGTPVNTDQTNSPQPGHVISGTGGDTPNPNNIAL